MAEKKLFRVRGLNGTPYSPKFQTAAEYADKWTALLRRWHVAEDTVYCLCREAAPVRLVIRRYQSGKLALARHPGTGPDHDTGCKYYGPSATAGWMAGAYVPGVVKEEDGVYKVRLAIGRTMREPKARVPGVESRRSTPADRTVRGLPRQVRANVHSYDRTGHGDGQFESMSGRLRNRGQPNVPQRLHQLSDSEGREAAKDLLGTTESNWRNMVI
jgi:hypothetical protein